MISSSARVRKGVLGGKPGVEHENTPCRADVFAFGEVYTWSGQGRLYTTAVRRSRKRIGRSLHQGKNICTTR